jgi:nitrous oxide reductase accessory protein NosL
MKQILLLALLAAGCGSAKTPTPTPPVTQDANVSGQYDLALTSTNGHGTTNIYKTLPKPELHLRERQIRSSARRMICHNALAKMPRLSLPAER